MDLFYSCSKFVAILYRRSIMTFFTIFNLLFFFYFKNSIIDYHKGRTVKHILRAKFDLNSITRVFLCDKHKNILWLIWNFTRTFYTYITSWHEKGLYFTWLYFVSQFLEWRSLLSLIFIWYLIFCFFWFFWFLFMF